MPRTVVGQANDSIVKEVILGFLYDEKFTRFNTFIISGKTYKVYVDNGESYRTIVLSINDPKVRLMRWGEIMLYKDDWIEVESILVKRKRAVIKAVHWIWNHGEIAPLKKGGIYLKCRKGKWEVTGNTLL